MKNILVTHFHPMTEIFKRYADLAMAHNEKSAKEQGFEVQFSTARNNPENTIYRERAWWLCHVMDGCADGDRILWMDADAVIVGKNLATVFDHVKDGEVGLTKFKSDKWNCGVMAFIVGPVTRKLFAEILNHVHGYGDHDKVEEWSAHECANCALPTNERGPLCGSSKHGLIDLPDKWNDAKLNPDSEIVGFHLMDGYSKYRRIRQTIDALKGPLNGNAS
jgi:hypothetical protein